MQECFALYDVQSQPQYSARQRREQIMNEGAGDEDSQDYSDTDGVDMPQTQQTEEIYRVNIADDTRPTTEFRNEQIRPSSPTGDGSRGQQQGRGSRGRSSQRPVGTSRVSGRSGSRGSSKKQSFEKTLTDAMNGFRDFQRQSSQQFGGNVWNPEEYDEIMVAINLFESLSIERNDDFHFACINKLSEEKLWRKYFIEKAEDTLENQLKFLENLTGVSREGAIVEKRLRSSHHFGSPRLGGLYSGSPSSGGQWGAAFQQWGGHQSTSTWGTPPNAQHWGTPPTGPQWGTPPNATQWISPPSCPQWGPPPNQQWGSTSNAPQWGTPPNAQRWGSTLNAPQWGTPPNTQGWGSTSNAPQWGTPPNTQGWGSTSNAQQWGSSESAPSWTPTTNVHHGFTVESQLHTTNNVEDGVSDVQVSDSQNTRTRGSPEYEFNNYSSIGQTGRVRRMGGLFNIWGTERGPDLNASHTDDVVDKD